MTYDIWSPATTTSVVNVLTGHFFVRDPLILPTGHRNGLPPCDDLGTYCPRGAKEVVNLQIKGKLAVEF